MRWLNGIVLLAFVVACGCAATWERSHSIVNAPRLAVEVEERMFKGDPQDAGFAHPATLNARAMAIFLKHLRYERPGSFLSEAKKLPVVHSDDDVETLAAAVTEGLGVCSPAQRVRFSVSNVYDWLPLLPERRTTRGVAFLQPSDTLNIAFDLVDDTPEVDEGDDLFFREWEDPTRYTISTFDLIIPHGASIKDPDDYPLWVVVPLQLITPPAEKPSEQPTLSATPPGTGKPDKQTSPEKKTETEESKALSDGERMQRLKYLQELYEKNIITEEKYKEEWKRIFKEY